MTLVTQSGSGRDITPAVASDAGAEVSILKPFEMDDMLAIVEQHVGNPEP